jgi:hypothetical protein
LRIAAIHLAGQALERFLSRLRLAVAMSGAIDGHGEPFVEPELLLELVATQAERAAGPGRHFRFEVANVRAERVRGLRLGVCEIAEEVQIVDARERARQIVLDELQDAAQGLDADLDENPRRLLDVVARGLNQTWGLPQLREHSPGALGGGRMREQRLACGGSTRECRSSTAGCAPTCGSPPTRTSARGYWRPAFCARDAR